MKRQRGLTLIELLIAMSLLALLSVLGYRAFASLLIARESLISTSSQWNDLARAFARIERDLASLAPGQHAKAISLNQGQLTLSVPSAASPDGQEARLYLPVSGGIAWAWRTAANPQLTRYPLLEAPGAHWALRLGDGSWRDHWPDGHGNPVALKLTLQLADGQKLERIWALP